jgi:hypothetical protein
MTKVFEVIAAWPLVFAAFYAISKVKDRHNKSGTSSQEKKTDEHGKTA